MCLDWLDPATPAQDIGLKDVMRTLKHWPLLALILLLPLITACKTAIWEEPEFPAELHGFGAPESFPLHVAGYDRAQVYAYEPTLHDVSIAYNHWAKELQAAATIYVYTQAFRHASLIKQAGVETEVIKDSHPGATVVSESEKTLTKGGREFPARQVVFEFDGVFAGEPRRLISELLLVKVDGNYVKLRHTAPIEQRETALRKAMSRTDWTENLPCFLAGKCGQS